LFIQGIEIVSIIVFILSWPRPVLKGGWLGIGQIITGIVCKTSMGWFELFQSWTPILYYGCSSTRVCLRRSCLEDKKAIRLLEALSPGLTQQMRLLSEVF
jgi:hypothetical protein